MNKKLLLLAFISLTGCQTSGQLSSMATNGITASCEQIQGAFSAYDADRTSVDTLTNLGKMINVEYGEMASAAVQASDSYYQNVKDATNIALTIKGCPQL
ncbi:hypothetical protein [Alkalimarinus sediminis]|uniref:Lipoprotein n=1 Tax=Alkalimarinus sediminis TaxID=1632866 RepID=A0A9E8HKG1_9ALTE|nr:hypothetical protein [Alkalimarinus sediminis]UZW74997.1 hypothetical protein NNL22_18555 [Alkalimarinus sediminis]